MGEDDVRQQLTEAFQECGEINSVRLPTDRETGALKGIAFIEFANPEGKVSMLSRLQKCLANGCGDPSVSSNAICIAYILQHEVGIPCMHGFNKIGHQHLASSSTKFHKLYVCMCRQQPPTWTEVRWLAAT